MMMAGPVEWGIVNEGWRKGPWTPEEDRLLIEYVRVHGEGRWSSVAKLAGLKRNGKSCRLRWVNYLRPDLKRGKITPQEENIIVELHARWGNRWSTIARSLPGRTDNEIKNYWRTHFKKNGKSSQNAERTKRRALKRQEQKQLQQQRQQLWLQQHQLQQQTLQLQLDQHHHQQQTLQPQFDPKKGVTQLEQADYKVPMFQSKTDTALMGPVIEHQYMSTMFHVDSSPPEAALSDEGLWGGLWNLEDIWADLENTCATSRAMEENQVAPSFCPGFFN